MALPDGPLKPVPEPNRGEPKIFLPKNVSLHIFFTAHDSRQDLGDFNHFRNLIRNSDIFIPESTDWVDYMAKNYNSISKGDYKVYTRIRDNILRDTNNPSDFNIALIEAVYSSRARIDFIDVQGNEFDRGIDSAIETFSKYTGDSFQDELALADNFCRQFARLQGPREDHMLEQIGPKLTDIIESHPKWRSQDKVSVLLFLGSVHTRIAKILQDRVKPTESGLPNISYEFSNREILSSDELANKYKEGEVVSKDEQYRLLLGTIAYKLIDGNFFKPGIRKTLVKISKILSEEEIIEFFNAQKKIDIGIGQKSQYPIINKVESLVESYSKN